MGFKLGRERGLQASRGEIKNKLRFKREQPSIPGTPVIRKDLEPNVQGEANMDGTIYISNNITPGSEEERQVLIHEMRQATDIKLGLTEVPIPQPANNQVLISILRLAVLYQ